MTCKDCVHYDICLLQSIGNCLLQSIGNENKQCCHFKNKADFVDLSYTERNCMNCKHSDVDETELEYICDGCFRCYGFSDNFERKESTDDYNS